MAIRSTVATGSAARTRRNSRCESATRTTQSNTGYDHLLVAARPLPAGEYEVFYNSSAIRALSCNFVPDDAYDDFTVTVHGLGGDGA